MNPIRIELVRIRDNDIVLHIHTTEDKCPERHLGAVGLQVGQSVIVYQPEGLQLHKVEAKV